MRYTKLYNVGKMKTIGKGLSLEYSLLSVLMSFTMLALHSRN